MRLRTYWYRADREAWVFGLVLLVLAALFAAALKAVYGYKDERRRHALEAHRQNLACLARNVYFEGRGEPLAGQYAIAEVTMNRKASRFYPKTVCEVVYQREAFSWTGTRNLEKPDGEAWAQAQKVAEDVYYGRRPASMPGVTHFHATYVRPDWSAERKRVAKIGRHVFYR